MCPFLVSASQQQRAIEYWKLVFLFVCALFLFVQRDVLVFVSVSAASTATAAAVRATENYSFPGILEFLFGISPFLLPELFENGETTTCGIAFCFFLSSQPSTQQILRQHVLLRLVLSVRYTPVFVLASFCEQCWRAKAASTGRVRRSVRIDKIIHKDWIFSTITSSKI